VKYTLTILEDDFNKLTDFLFDGSGVEQAAYLLCRTSATDTETRFLVREVVFVNPDEINYQQSDRMSIKPESYMRAMKRAVLGKQSFIFVHSHPTGFDGFSAKDDIEEASLFKTAYNRIETGIHASLVFSEPRKVKGRVWLDRDGSTPISRIRVLGKRYEFIDLDGQDIDYSVFDRQVLAFGKKTQKLLSSLCIGVIGCGGTGSSVIEQLIRLGVGRIIVLDGDLFEATNVSRIYSSRIIDEDLPKVKLMQRLAADVGLGTKLIPINKKVVYESAAKELRNCDLIFGCTDDHWGRSILNKIAISYYIPVIDMGVRIDSKDGILRSVTGRVTRIQPGAACLFCRDRINVGRIRAESLNPEESRRLVALGYAEELPERDPAVIAFTTNIASLAITEMIHLLTGFMGRDRTTTEVIFRYDQTELLRNSTLPKEECFCGQRAYFGKGDQDLFLDITWPQE